MTPLEERVRQLTERFIAAIPERIDAIAQALRVAAASPESDIARADLRRHLHAMSGTAATYGFPRLAELAGQAEELCGKPLTPRTIGMLRILIDCLAEERR